MFNFSFVFIFFCFFFVCFFIKKIKVFCVLFKFNTVVIYDSLFIDHFNSNKYDILLHKIFNIKKKKNKKNIMPIIIYNVLYLNDIFFKNKYHLNKVCNISFNYKFIVIVKKDNTFLFKRRKNKIFFKKIHIIINNLA
jgi:hypothetical protein